MPFVVRTEDEEKSAEMHEAETVENKEDDHQREKMEEEGGKEAEEELSPDSEGQVGGNESAVKTHRPTPQPAQVSAVEAEMQKVALEKKDNAKRWILVGETYIHGLDEWLHSEDSKDIEESKVSFTLV